MARDPGKPRPMWQRIVMPAAGVILCLIGIAGCIMPIIPGVPFLIFGFPLLFCFNHEWERWARDHIRRMIAACKRGFRRLRGACKHAFHRLRGRHS
jgi:uncharacterized membrane protein YbaN (DUF454 family)